MSPEGGRCSGCARRRPSQSVRGEPEPEGEPAPGPVPGPVPGPGPAIEGSGLGLAVSVNIRLVRAVLADTNRRSDKGTVCIPRPDSSWEPARRPPGYACGRMTQLQERPYAALDCRQVQLLPAVRNLSGLARKFAHLSGIPDSSPLPAKAGAIRSLRETRARLLSRQKPKRRGRWGAGWASPTQIRVVWCSCRWMRTWRRRQVLFKSWGVPVRLHSSSKVASGWFSRRYSANRGTVKSSWPRRGAQMSPFWIRPSRWIETPRWSLAP